MSARAIGFKMSREMANVEHSVLVSIYGRIADNINRCVDSVLEEEDCEWVEVLVKVQRHEPQPIVKLFGDTDV